MSLVRLLELMKKYDFSSVSDYTGRNPHAWSGFYGGIEGDAQNIVELGFTAEKKAEVIDRVYAMFGYLRTRYDGIDFGELETEITSEEDRYFVEPLFKTRDLLPQLGRAIHAVVATPSKETYEQLRSITQQLWDADHPQYRHRIEELEQKLKSQPAPVS